jgi:hypothetical protein
MAVTRRRRKKAPSPEANARRMAAETRRRKMKAPSLRVAASAKKTARKRKKKAPSSDLQFTHPIESNTTKAAGAPPAAFSFGSFS